MLSVDPNEFELVRPLAWEEVLGSWRDDEAGQERWIELYKDRGFASWDEWRGNYVAPLQLDKREWHLYRVPSPLSSVPQWWGGPFRSWKKFVYGERDTMQFTELVKKPEVAAHEVINKMVEDFPSPTMLIGVRRGEKVVIIEGMHRCCAVALAAERGRDIGAEIMIALADWGEGKMPWVGRNIKK